MNQVTIQLKVYDRDGRRVYMEEAKLPPFIDAAGATKWVEMACRSLKKDLKLDAKPLDDRSK